MHEILKLEFFNKTLPGASARSDERAHKKIRTQIKVLDRKISRFRPGTVGGHTSTSRLLSLLLLLTVGLSLVAFVILVAVIVGGGRVHQLEDATGFPLMI